jgi:hypothetical protein
VLAAQTPDATSGPPPSAPTGGFFPLSQVHPGMTATAWTVFSGTKPEPMQVEILGVLRGARGPGQDLILARLHGAKPEYTGVVAGMSGSPVYIGGKLLGSLSYRIGQFTKEPIAGITPIEQMLEVRDLPINANPTPPTPIASRSQPSSPCSPPPMSLQSGMNFQAMETPLVMSGFHPEAIRSGSSKWPEPASRPSPPAAWRLVRLLLRTSPIPPSAALLLPGSAVSMQLIRGDLEVAATCTVTYVDPKQLLACGHPVLQAPDPSPSP